MKRLLMALSCLFVLGGCGPAASAAPSEQPSGPVSNAAEGTVPAKDCCASDEPCCADKAPGAAAPAEPSCCSTDKAAAPKPTDTKQ